MSDLPTVPSRLLKATGAVARVALWLMLSGWFLLAAVWGALHLLIVPRIGDLRPHLEAQVSRVVGVPVKIGSITAHSIGLIPSFELTDVKLFDQQGRSARLCPGCWLRCRPSRCLPSGLSSCISTARKLHIRRTPQGKIMVAGLDFSKGSADDGAAADWLFSQSEFVIRNGRVSWTDELRNEPTLDLKQVDLVMRSKYRNHSLRLDATPPAEVGDRFQAMAVFRQPLLSRRNGQWRDWDGQLYGSFERVDVSRLGRLVDIGLQVTQGHGALRAWADFSRGEMTGAMADVALANVSTTLDPGCPAGTPFGNRQTRWTLSSNT